MAYGIDEFPHGTNYDSDLRELLYYYKKLKEQYTKLLADYEDIKEDYDEILSYYENIESIIETTIDNKFAVLSENLEKEIKEFIDKVESELDSMEDELVNLRTAIELLYDNIKEYSDAKDEEVKALMRLEMFNYAVKLQRQIDALEEKLKEYPENIYVYNEGSGRYDTLQNTLNMIYDWIKTEHGLTVAEYRALGLTVEKYRSYNMSVKEYAILAKLIINHYYKLYTNTVTGKKNTIENLQSWAITLYYNTMKVEEYRELNLTVAEYRALNLSTLDYLKYYYINPSLEGVVKCDSLGNGLTVSQYGNLRVL